MAKRKHLQIKEKNRLRKAKSRTKIKSNSIVFKKVDERSLKQTSIASYLLNKNHNEEQRIVLTPIGDNIDVNGYDKSTFIYDYCNDKTKIGNRSLNNDKGNSTLIEYSSVRIEILSMMKDKSVYSSNRKLASAIGVREDELRRFMKFQSGDGKKNQISLEKIKSIIYKYKHNFQRLTNKITEDLNTVNEFNSILHYNEKNSLNNSKMYWDNNIEESKILVSITFNRLNDSCFRYGFKGISIDIFEFGEIILRPGWDIFPRNFNIMSKDEIEEKKIYLPLGYRGKTNFPKNILLDDPISVYWWVEADPTGLPLFKAKIEDKLFVGNLKNSEGNKIGNSTAAKLFRNICLHYNVNLTKVSHSALLTGNRLVGLKNEKVIQKLLEMKKSAKAKDDELSRKKIIKIPDSYARSTRFEKSKFLTMEIKNTLCHYVDELSIPDWLEEIFSHKKYKLILGFDSNIFFKDGHIIQNVIDEINNDLTLRNLVEFYVNNKCDKNVKRYLVTLV